MQIYYPPLFRVTPESGSFSIQPFELAESPVLRAEMSLGPQVPVINANAANAATQRLVDNYRNRPETHAIAAALPAHVRFPSVGPYVYLVAELTAESKGPVVDLSYQKERKGGDK